MTDVPVLPEDKELQEKHNEYLQKCCEVGQLLFNLDQLDGQRRKMEKELEVTQNAAKSAAARHKEIKEKQLAKLKIANSAPSLEINSEGASH